MVYISLKEYQKAYDFAKLVRFSSRVADYVGHHSPRVCMLRYPTWRL